MRCAFSGLLPMAEGAGAVSLGELATVVGGVVGCGENVRIIDMTHDSKQCGPGMLFACVRGAAHDGHDFAATAVRSGAVALLVQRQLKSVETVPQLVVPDVRAVLAACAAAVHKHPSKRVRVIGVTGTAGKTTVCHAISQMLKTVGRQSAQLGTLDGERTTPEATDLNRWLAAVADSHPGEQQFAVMEVSSHALRLDRVCGIGFAAGVFTNLSSEHLDFHCTMQDYFEAKAELFDGRSAIAVVNIGCEWGRRLVEGIQERDCALPIHPYTSADMSDVEVSAEGLLFSWRGQRVRSRLIGRFNLENLAAAAATGLALGLSEAEVAAGLEGVTPVGGRMQPVGGRMQPVSAAAVGGAPDPMVVPVVLPMVLVDYAHKPDALSAALSSAREVAEARAGSSIFGRLWVVFGAGGERDTAKRPLMGEIAARLADFVIVTSDNSRSEDPDAIAAEIEAGIPTDIGSTTSNDSATTPGNTEVHRILDRAAAIAYAIDHAAAADVVVIAGKGHETTQTGHTGTLPFDDSQVAAVALEARAARSSIGGVR